MKSHLLLLVLTLGLPCSLWAREPSSLAPAAVSADEALRRLQDGNGRFVSGQVEHPRADRGRLQDTSTSGQHPFAIVISCSDSRVPPEIIFDQGVGDVFVVRVAGNVVGTHEIGSAEYALEHLATQLLVVLGHTGCGAVAAAVSGGEVHGNVASIVEIIRPAVAEAQRTHPKLHGKDLMPAAVEANVWNSAHKLVQLSSVVRDLAHDGKLKIVGGVYDIATGKVSWLGESSNVTTKAATSQR